jgi:hypothetical protein
MNKFSTTGDGVQRHDMYVQFYQNQKVRPSMKRWQQIFENFAGPLTTSRYFRLRHFQALKSGKE